MVLISIKNLFSLLVLTMLMMAMTVTDVKAQSNYGAVRGLVTDVQGASLPGAIVLLTSEAKKTTRSTVSNGAGEYVFSAVDPGTYTVSVSSDGFKKSETKGIVVDSGNTIPFDVALRIGSSSQSIEVSATEAVVNNGTSYNGQLIDSQKLQNLPNPGRNPFLFSKLDNNVTVVGDPRFVRFQDQSGSSTISIAGAPISSNNYAIDGIPITDFSNRAVIIPSIESVEGVKVQANTYDAEIGRTSGGMFNTTLRTGSSTLHGVLQGETRQTNWGANLYFNNRTPSTVNGVTQPTTPRGAAEFYSYVGSLGGPIPLPKILGGKDKTFFWITEEGYRQRSPLTASNAFPVPTALQRTGDFSEIGTVTNGVCTSGRCIYDPASSKLVDGKVVRTPFAGNKIPTGQINAVGQAILLAYPNPNTTITAYGTPNFNGGDTLGDRADEFVGKLDHQFGVRWNADFYYMHYGSKEPGGNALTTFPGSSSSYLLYRKVDAIGIQNTIMVTPTMVLTVGFGFNRFPNNTQDISTGFDQTKLGLPASYVSALAKTGFPRITTSSANTLAYEGTSNSGPAVYFSRNFVTGIAKSLGKHSVKAGYVYRAISLTYTSLSDASGTYAFDSAFTSADNTTTSTSGGADAADMLLGLPSSGAVILPSKLAITTAYQAGYLQDDWRATQKLTFNLGIRYEHEPGVHERSNHYSVGFDRTVTNPLSGTSGVTTLGGVRFAGTNGYPTTTGSMGSKWSPRAGVAYALSDRTVVQAGYGLFYMPLVYSGSASLAPGYVATNSYVTASVNGLPGTTLSNPFPTGLAGPTGNSAGYLTGVGSSLTVIDQGRRSPLFESYSASVEHQFPMGIAVKLGYVGGHGRNLNNSYNLNQLSDSNLALGASYLNTSVPNPYYGRGGTGAIGTPTVARSVLLKPFPEFTTITDSVSDGKSKYNAMDVKVQKQFSKGLTVLAAYTWSSNWDNQWGASSTLNPGNNGPQDIYNLAPEYSRAINDIPNRFTVAATYELPFGHGKQFLGGADRWLDLAVGGWKFNDIMILQNGSPLPITQASNANSSYGNLTTRPSLVTGVNPCFTGSPQGRLNQYFNPAAFTATPAGSYGNAPRTLGCYGPGYVNSDLSLNKNFHVSERVNAEFRAEALNAFNTAEFNGPNLVFNSPSAGQITGTLGFPRLIQLGARLTF
jgi:hypothetical protein